MSQYGLILDSLKSALAAASPDRIVTRELKDFADRDRADITKGVYTLISQGLNADENDEETLDVLLVGQIELTESASPSAIEEAELSMIDEIRSFARKVSGARIVLGRFRQSAQLDAPYGFISGTLKVGPFYFEDVLDPSPAPFITFHAESQLDADTEPEIVIEESLPQ